MSPEPRASMHARPEGYRRLFRDSRAEELRYFRKYGFVPVMHLLVAKRELAERHPGLVPALMAMFDQAKQAAYRFYEDTAYSLIVGARTLYEEQRAMLGPDPWVNGFAANRKNLAQFLEDAHDQRLTGQLLQPERLFHASTLNT
jgi:4,5-dihydroxyphthalate decarboxylase